jgi:hypothetical protein
MDEQNVEAIWQDYLAMLQHFRGNQPPVSPKETEFMRAVFFAGASGLHALYRELLESTRDIAHLHQFAEQIQREFLVKAQEFIEKQLARSQSQAN